MHKIIKKSHIFNKKFQILQYFQKCPFRRVPIYKEQSFLKDRKIRKNTVCNTKTFPKIILIRSVLKEKMNPTFLFLKLLCL